MTLKEVAENPKNLGADIGFIGVLHTWAQNLIDHPHVHFIVPGGGLNKKKTRWIASPDNYFLPVKVLSLVFRAKCLSLLEDSFDNDKLSFWGVNDLLKEAEHFKSLLKDCTKKDWIVYAKKPFAGPKQVINYLGGYTHRIAISNYRLEKVENEVVYFKVRDKDNPGQNKVISLGVKEFMRRFLLHVLPNKFVRIRHFGILGTRMKKEKMELIRKLEGMVEYIQENLFEKWEDQLKRLSGIEVNVCPKCKIGQLIETEKIKGLLSLNTC
jgi:hypothetical protein